MDVLQCLCQSGDLDECFTLLSDDFTYWSIVTRTSIDKATLRREIQRRQRLAETTLDFIRCIHDGDCVVVEAHGRITVGGARYDNPYVFLFDTCDGLIVSIREYSDTRLAEELFG